MRGSKRIDPNRIDTHKIVQLTLQSYNGQARHELYGILGSSQPLFGRQLLSVSGSIAEEARRHLEAASPLQQPCHSGPRLLFP